MKRPIALVGASVAVIVGAGLAWRRFPRVGTRFVNQFIDPLIIEHGLAGVGPSELGSLEHVGRRSGLVRCTPVHPVATPDGFRIIVPLGERSEWASNVLAAGHCRLQLHDLVFELDEPVLVSEVRVAGIPALARWTSRLLGFRYLTLRTFATRPGSLVDTATEARPTDIVAARADDEAAPEPAGASAECVGRA